MSIEDDITLFERVPTLALLGREALRILAIGSDARYVHAGDPLFRRGEAADAGYVVQEGSFSVSAHEGASDTVTVGPGALLGELALITETERPVTAIAREPCSVIRIPRALFLKMLEGYPEAARQLRDAFAARTDQATSELRRVRIALGRVSGPS